MKKILFNFGFNDLKAIDVFEQAQGMLSSLGYEVLSCMEDSWWSETEDFVAESIKQSSVLIAFVSDRTTNVLFETGYAYGIGKVVIVVSDFSLYLPRALRSVHSIDARLGAREIAYEIYKQIDKIETVGWKTEEKLPTSLKEMLELKNARPEHFELISSEAFEDAIYNDFLNHGFSVERDRQYGYDFVAVDRFNRRLLVEVKKRNLNSKISIATVQQLLGAAHAYGVGRALLISTAEFTDSARRFAAAQGGSVQLWTMIELERFSIGGKQTTTVEGLVEIAN